MLPLRCPGSAETGRLRARLALAGEDPVVTSFRGGLVAYTAGIDLHVLSVSGKLDGIVGLPGAGEPPLAALSARGLYISCAIAGDDTPTRLLLVPYGAVLRGVAARGTHVAVAPTAEAAAFPRSHSCPALQASCALSAGARPPFSSATSRMSA